MITAQPGDPKYILAQVIYQIIYIQVSGQAGDYSSIQGQGLYYYQI
jgi:hypothetical protein